jgi:hypothetical protein
MPLAQWRTYRERARQKRKVLRMLALSGVVRPSHVELRYPIPILKVGTSNASSYARPTASTQQSEPLQSFVATMRLQGKQLLQWLRQRLVLQEGS